MNVTAIATHKYPFVATQQHNNDGEKDDDEDHRNKRDSTVVVRLTFQVLRAGGWGSMGGYCPRRLGDVRSPSSTIP